MATKIRADALSVGHVVVEHRCKGAETREVYLDVTNVEVGRFVHYSLSDGSERSLSPYVEVKVLTNAHYWTTGPHAMSPEQRERVLIAECRRRGLLREEGSER